MKTGFYLIGICICLVTFSGCPSTLAEEKKIPVLVLTDFGRDIDDAEAFAYLATNPAIELTGAVCNSYIPEVRARSLGLFLRLFHQEIPIATGAAFPWRTTPEPEQLLRYLQEHSIEDVPYETALEDSLKSWSSDLSPITLYDPVLLIDSLLKHYAGELRIVVLSQATDIAGYLFSHPGHIPLVHSIYLQGQARIDERGQLLPDSAAYNLREDMEAARYLFTLQEQIPFTLAGKHAAYPMAYTQEEMQQLAARCGQAGKYLERAASMGLTCFLQRDPALFYRIFQVPDTLPAHRALASIDQVSNPYDLLTAIAIDRPDLFEATRQGIHTLIGMNPGETYFQDSVRIKQLLLMEN